MLPATNPCRAPALTAAYGVAKTLLGQAASVDQLDYHLDEELRHLVQAADGRDVKEGLTAFFGKRAPVFEMPPAD
jgi:enoyl-CoA hydratase/carnithine racemase